MKRWNSQGDPSSQETGLFCSSQYCLAATETFSRKKNSPEAKKRPRKAQKNYQKIHITNKKGNHSCTLKVKSWNLKCVFFPPPVLYCSLFNTMSLLQNMKVARSSCGLKSKLQCLRLLRRGKHLVAISLQSSPGIPGRGHSRIDTGPMKNSVFFTSQAKHKATFTHNHLWQRNGLIVLFLPGTPPCWVCSYVAFWRHKRCPPCSDTGSSPGGCCRHRTPHCGRHHYCGKKCRRQISSFFRRSEDVITSSASLKRSN